MSRASIPLTYTQTSWVFLVWKIKTERKSLGDVYNVRRNLSSMPCAFGGDTKTSWSSVIMVYVACWMTDCQNILASTKFNGLSQWFCLSLCISAVFLFIVLFVSVSQRSFCLSCCLSLRLSLSQRSFCLSCCLSLRLCLSVCLYLFNRRGLLR